MDYIRKFKDLDLHNLNQTKSDNEKTPFITTARVREEHKKTLYGCAFNQYIPWGETQVVATVGAQFMHVYQLPADANQISSVWSARLSSDQEDLYAVAWCFDTYENEQGRNPYKIVAGGECGQIYVVDAVAGQLTNFKRLVSIGWTVNDLRTSPTDSNLVACASRDQTVRVFHIRNDTCLLVMGGFHSHRDQILSVDWTENSNQILSCGLDHQVMQWDLTPEHIQKHLKTACKLLESGEINILKQDEEMVIEEADNQEAEQTKSEDILDLYRANADDGKRLQELNGRLGKPKGCLLPIHNPQAICSDLHNDYVDCVRVLGGSQFYLTKACGKEQAICLWRFGPPRGLQQKKTSPYEPITTVTRLKTWTVPSGETWFTKFDVDPRRRFLACGGAGGIVSFYTLAGTDDDSPLLTVTVSPATIRQVSFCTSGRIVVAVGEDGYVSRLDRVPSSVDKKELAKFISSK